MRKADFAVVCAQFRSRDQLSSPLGNFRKFSTRSIRKICPISTACLRGWIIRFQATHRTPRPTSPSSLFARSPKASGRKERRHSNSVGSLSVVFPPGQARRKTRLSQVLVLKRTYCGFTPQAGSCCRSGTSVQKAVGNDDARPARNARVLIE